MTICARSTAGSIRNDTRSTYRARRNSSGGQPLPDQIRDGRPHQLEPGHAQPSVHQKRAQHRGQREAGDDVAQRAHGVLHAAHPAVARRRDEDRRHPEDRDSHPRQRLVGDLSACGQSRHQRHRSGLDHDDDQRAQTQRQPGGLHPLTDGRAAVPGAEEPGRAGGGAVRQKRHLRTQRAQDQAADREARQRQRAQSAHDGEVEQQIDGFCGQNSECGQGQCGDAAAGRLAYRRVARRFRQDAG